MPIEIGFHLCCVVVVSWLVKFCSFRGWYWFVCVLAVLFYRIKCVFYCPIMASIRWSSFVLSNLVYVLFYVYKYYESIKVNKGVFVSTYNSIGMLERCKMALYEEISIKTLVNTCKIPNTMVSVYQRMTCVSSTPAAISMWQMSWPHQTPQNLPFFLLP